MVRSRVLSRLFIYIYIYRTIQQYSPPGEWIMCELGVFPIFLENDLLKVPKILGLSFFKARKDLEGFNMAKNLAQEKFGPKTKFIYEKQMDNILPRGIESPFLSALHAKNDIRNLFRL